MHPLRLDIFLNAMSSTEVVDALCNILAVLLKQGSLRCRSNRRTSLQMLTLRCPCFAAEKRRMAQVRLDRAVLEASINDVLAHWVPKLANFQWDQNPNQVTETKIMLKHFLEDMYSVANYAELRNLIANGNGFLDIGTNVLCRVYPRFDDDAWYRTRLTNTNGRTALRNIGAHRQLPNVIVAENTYVSADMNDDGRQNIALDVRTTGTFMGIVRMVQLDTVPLDAAIPAFCANYARLGVY